MNKTQNIINDVGRELLELGTEIEPLIQRLFPEKDREDFLTEPFYHHMAAGGKRVRPALGLLTCRELGGSPDDALWFATAVEILHNMFLVHDDFQDGDRMRRDAPAVWTKYGAANAINLGDFMLGRAYTAVLNSPVSPQLKCRLTRLFTNTYENTCRGQALDLNWRGREGMTVEKYMEMVKLKTADYLVLGMIGGALIAGAGDEVLESLRRLGAAMGPAFQIRDDVIDLTIGKGRGGELGNDIKEGKPSILFAHAVNHGSEEEKEILLQVASKPREKTSRDDVNEVIAIYKNCGSIEYAEKKAHELTLRANKAVSDMSVENKNVFEKIVQFMTERTT